jgi:hypothetical protein
VLPATVLLGITDADLDALASAPDEEYWTVLNRIAPASPQTGARQEAKVDVVRFVTWFSKD